jgi:hypothetical protein
VFERFVEEAVRSILGARDEARGLGHHAVGTEHLILALAQADPKVAGAFSGRELTVADLRGATARVFGRGASESVPAELPFSPDAQKAIALSWSIAEEFRHSTIVPLHLFMAILRIDGAQAHRVFGAVHLDVGDLARQTHDWLTPSAKPPGWRGGYQEDELEIATRYGPLTLTLVRQPDKGREDARIISLSAESLTGPEALGSFLSDFDRLLDASASGITVAFFRDLFLGMGTKLESYLKPE